jgi:tRNA(Arg) A34 adenosine deaminase TadA
VADVPRALQLRLPAWADELLDGVDGPFAAVEERMAFVLEAARRHVDHGTGGPFAAAVFERPSGRLLSLGVNLVVPTSVSVAHAEIVALALAGAGAGTFDLGAFDAELVTSAEPCAMCLGALPWSGINSLVCGVRDAAIREIGFDEGHKPADWVEALGDRGIAVTLDVHGEEAAAVLRAYVAAGGVIYNGAEPAELPDGGGGVTGG